LSGIPVRPGAPRTLSRVSRRVVAVVVALVAVVGGALALGPSTAAAPGVDRSGAVVLIGTGGISWSDVSEETTPNLWGMLRDGSSAALSIRSVWSNTCPADGWLGLSAGARAGAPRTGEAADPANRPCTGPPTVTGERVTEWPQYEAQANSEKFDSRLGLLSEQLGKVGLCVRAVGPYAPLGAATPTGGVTRWSEWDSEQLVQDLNACPVTLVDVGAVRDPDEVAPGEGMKIDRPFDPGERIGLGHGQHARCRAQPFEREVAM